MPVACPRATGATPATAAATSNATSRPMASLPLEIESVRQGTHAGRHRSAPRALNVTARPRACGRAVTTNVRLMPEGQPKPDADRECARQHAGREGVREVALGPEHGAPVGEPLPDPTTDCELGFGTRTGAELQDVQPHPRRHVRCAHQAAGSAPPFQHVQHVHAGAECDGPDVRVPVDRGPHFEHVRPPREEPDARVDRRGELDAGSAVAAETHILERQIDAELVLGAGLCRGAPLRRHQTRHRRQNRHEERAADALPHEEASLDSDKGKSEGRDESHEQPHIAKSDALICQDASTRSATTRTASPITWRKPPATVNRLDVLPCCTCNTPTPSSVRNGAWRGRMPTWPSNAGATTASAAPSNTARSGETTV